MRALILPLFALLLSAPALGATESDPTDARAPEVVPSAVVEAAPEAEATMQLAEVSLEERTASEDASAAQLPQRGSFWWLVGVIVVAGVILAVLL